MEGFAVIANCCHSGEAMASSNRQGRVAGGGSRPDVDGGGAALARLVDPAGSQVITAAAPCRDSYAGAPGPRRNHDGSGLTGTPPVMRSVSSGRKNEYGKTVGS